MPISNLCIATNMKYEGGRGVGENILDETKRQDYWGGTGTPKGFRLFPLTLYYIPILSLWFNPFITQN